MAATVTTLYSQLYHRPHQMADGRWAVVHALPGYAHLPVAQQAVAVDAEGLPDHTAAAKEAAWLNAQRLRDEVRWANTAGLRGVRL